MTVNRIRFGAELKRRRLAAGLSQVALAERSGTTPNSIARMERGERGPSLSMAQALALALRCKVDDLLSKGGKR